jgi:hypothetical protein
MALSKVYVDPPKPAVITLESDAILRKMFTILDKAIHFTENSEFSALRKKYDELKGQGK